ncbi:hypothetical protein Poly30_19600 [Planctomycetes bacterium Poly30]|uniref:Uncharacterized protein n=1 Tax=Saltatorellus ferox TaxID=2528018 RepID=A0A518EQT1_9BACT|nr:hypothetical protein Poly30_19600 [Planctomycetes bacterium Poly30]
MGDWGPMAMGPVDAASGGGGTVQPLAARSG